MNAAHQLLGIIAEIHQRLNRYALNGLSASWMLLIASGLLFIVYSSKWPEAEFKLGTACLAVISGIVFLSLVQTKFRHDIVFRTEPDEQRNFISDLTTPNREINISGRFTFDQSTKSSREIWWDRILYGTSTTRWFLEVPGEYTIQSKNDFLFSAHVDASMRLFGVLPLDKRSGIWSILVKQEESLTLSRGRLYRGFGIRPALRFRGKDSRGGRIHVVISFANDGEREATVAARVDRT